MYLRLSCLAIALALGANLFSAAALVAQEKDVTIEGQLKVGVHKFKLDKGKLYQIEVKAKDFDPNVSMIGQFLRNTVQFGKERHTFRAAFLPSQSTEYTLVVLPTINFGQPQQTTLDYAVTLKTLQVAEMPVLKIDDKLTANEPKYQASFRKTAFKAIPFKMKSGQTIIIDMVRAGNANTLDPFLYLENPAKQIVTQDDDGGGFPNARIVYTATMDGEFRIIASGLSDRSDTGDFKLTVRTVK